MDNDFLVRLLAFIVGAVILAALALVIRQEWSERKYRRRERERLRRRR